MTRSGRRTDAFRPGLAAAALVVAALTLAGCASSEDPGTTGSSPATTPAGTATGTPTVAPSDSPSAGGTTVQVTFQGDTVTPNGERLKVKAGEDLTLEVTADAAGEIHVHSTPEQELDYQAGTTTLTVKDLDQPGIVEVESHALDKVILQLLVQ